MADDCFFCFVTVTWIFLAIETLNLLQVREHYKYTLLEKTACEQILSWAGQECGSSPVWIERGCVPTHCFIIVWLLIKGFLGCNVFFLFFFFFLLSSFSFFRQYRMTQLFISCVFLPAPTLKSRLQRLSCRCNWYSDYRRQCFWWFVCFVALVCFVCFVWLWFFSPCFICIVLSSLYQALTFLMWAALCW